MKIDKNPHLQLLDNLTKSSSVKVKTDASQTIKENAVDSTADKVELSGWKQEVARLKDKVKALPDVREDKVAAVQEKMNSETYNVKGELVARSILKNGLLDEII
jgi:negative regulator of flagellin synthesis FlgM